MKGIPTTFSVGDWPRKVAESIKGIIDAVRALQEPVAITLSPRDEPDQPFEGMIYFDRTSKKARVYDGTTWNDL